MIRTVAATRLVSTTTVSQCHYCSLHQIRNYGKQHVQHKFFSSVPCVFSIHAVLDRKLVSPSRILALPYCTNTENGSKMQMYCIRQSIGTEHSTQVLVEVDFAIIESSEKSLIPEGNPSALLPHIRTSRVDWGVCHQCTSCTFCTAVVYYQLSSLS